MKKNILYIPALAFAMGISSCNDKKTDEVTTPAMQAEEQIDNTATAADTVVTPKLADALNEDMQQVTITGKVTAINRGKDGYTATLTTADNKMYNATISIPNLKDPKEYRNVEIGQDIKVDGILYENDNIIKVEKLY